MAAKPKLSPEEWKHARNVWELDTRKGFVWLIGELGLPVSAEAVRLKSKNEAWEKRHEPSLENQKNKLGKRKKKEPSTEAKKKRNTTNVRVARTDVVKAEEVDEESDNHGNSKYCCDYNDQVYKLCLLGATDLEVANFFGVAESTINKWKLDYPSFSESMKKGKISADANVAYGLYKRSTGYRYSEVKRKVIFGEVDDGEDDDSDEKKDKGILVEVITTEKEVSPDTGAGSLWLRNRRPENWKDKVEASVDVKLDKETLQQIEETFLARMEKARARQDKILIERGILIEQEAAD